LEGSVRRSSDQVRINAQLVDAETGGHLWAERFDRDAGDAFAVQNEITGRIALTLHIELVGAEASRPIERPDAMDSVLRGRAAFYKSPTRENYAEAVGWFERALSLDPASIEAKSLLASILAERALARMTDTSTRRLCTCRGARPPGSGSVAAQSDCALCLRPGVARDPAQRTVHSGISGGARVQPQPG
jgi:hypothetical protein